MKEQLIGTTVDRCYQLFQCICGKDKALVLNVLYLQVTGCVSSGSYSIMLRLRKSVVDVAYEWAKGT